MLVPRRGLSVGAWLSVARTAAAFLAIALASIALTRETGAVTVFSPANGLLAGVLPRERTSPPWLSLSSPVPRQHGVRQSARGRGRFRGLRHVEAVLVCRVVTGLAGPSFILADLRQLFALLTTGLVVPAVSATTAAGLFSPAHRPVPSALWRNWWAGDGRCFG